MQLGWVSVVSIKEHEVVATGRSRPAGSDTGYDPQLVDESGLTQYHIFATRNPPTLVLYVTQNPRKGDGGPEIPFGESSVMEMDVTCGIDVSDPIPYIISTW
jgi:hypothetical protein